MRRISSFFTLLFFLYSGSFSFAQTKEGNPLAGKIICIDPGHGGTAATDSYRVGPAGEREEWINLRVAFLLKQMLEDKGARVVMTRTEDVFVPLPDRSKICVEAGSDIFISIHHNATADSSVNFPIIYFHGHVSENQAGVLFGKLLAKEFVTTLYKGKVSEKGNFATVASDFTVFPGAGASVLRNTYGIPAVLAEASFFSNAKEEQLLKSKSHNEDEAHAYLKALELFFSRPVPAIAEKNSLVGEIPPFQAFREAERMSPVAKRWKQDFYEALSLAKQADSASIAQALSLFTRSARSFPDSYLAAQCHRYRSELLEKSGETASARQESRRAKEYYAELPDL